MTEPSRELAASFDLGKLTADFYADPYPYYAALQEYEPVKLMPDGSYFLTRYRDILGVYKNTDACSSDKKVEFKPKYGDTPLYEHHTTSLVFNDPPLHTRVRRLIFGALTARAIAELEPALIALVDNLIDEMAQKREVDLIEDFASAIPVEVIGNLLAVPRNERGPLREWSLAILGALEPVVTPAAAERGNRAVTEFIAYLEGLIEDRRKNPGNPEKDVLTKLIQGDVNGEKLTPKELLHNCIFLLNAGHETTTNLIGNGLVALDRFPEQKQRLLADPGLIKAAIEEVLRYESSNQLGNRITVKPVEVGGVMMPENTKITVCIGAANRDPHEFPEPAKFDIGRAPNRHLAFASGIHQCVGMNLARLEGAIAISRFLARFPKYELTSSPTGGGRARFRGFLKVPARVA
ncbi:MAG: cytochrome P450 [Xanthobacteraceae bacterium]|nr:cytochrome P450 [Xanthobacteraceae bacterium]MCW5678141.1 cytochrome P450 [Xanthobacteraceae bacterium]